MAAAALVGNALVNARARACATSRAGKPACVAATRRALFQPPRFRHESASSRARNARGVRGFHVSSLLRAAASETGEAPAASGEDARQREAVDVADDDDDDDDDDDESSTAADSEEKTTTSWTDLGLPKNLVAALQRVGFDEPSAPQVAAIPRLMRGENVALQAHTGSGKTMAYLLPALAAAAAEEELPAKERSEAVQLLVVVPSQELAMQIVRQIERLLGDYGRAITQQCIGGANVRRQEEAIRAKKPLIVVGTPGRLAELSRTGILRTHGVKCLVIDEADDLLASNFRRDMARITDHTGKGVLGGRQTVIVSATLRRETLDQYGYMAPDLVHVVAGRAAVAREDSVAAVAAAKNSNSDSNSNSNSREATDDEVETTNASLPPQLEHYSVVAERGKKVDRLRRAIHATGAERALVFLNFGHRLSETRDKLATRGMECGVLHGGMNKLERAAELAAFRRGDFRALLVSDLAARGIDVPEIDAVFNLELPTDATHYVHRAGRTGRMGASGIVVSIAEEREAFVLPKLARSLGVEILAADLQKGRVVPDRGNKPTPRKEHAERASRASSSRSSAGGRGGGRGGRGGDRGGGGGGGGGGHYTPKGKPRRRERNAAA
jgi:superfamily II DNA/RNA helicase